MPLPRFLGRVEHPYEEMQKKVISLLFLVAVIGSTARGAGFIINQFHRRDIHIQETGGKRRRA